MKTICPKCGNEVTAVMLTSLPPKHEYVCMRCGWRGEIYRYGREFVGRCDSCGRSLYNDMDRYAAKVGATELWLCDNCVTLIKGESYV